MLVTVIALLVLALSDADIERLRRYAECWDLADHPEWAPMNDDQQRRWTDAVVKARVGSALVAAAVSFALLTGDAAISSRL